MKNNIISEFYKSYSDKYEPYRVDIVDKYSAEDLIRMKSGRAPIGSDGKPMELHHEDGSNDSQLVPMTMTDHRGGENYKNNHPWMFSQ